METQIKLITTSEVAAMFGVTTETVKNWIKNGFLPAVKKGDRLVFDKNTIDKLGDQLTDINDCEIKISQCLEHCKSTYHEIDAERRKLLEVLNFGRNLNEGLNYSIVNALIYASINFSILPPRSKDILIGYLSGKDYVGMATRYDLSKARIYQINLAAIRKATKGCDTVWDALRNAEEENGVLRSEIGILRTQIQEMAEKIGLAKIEDVVQVVVNEQRLQLLSTNIKDCDLSVRSLNCLKSADIKTLGDLVQHSKRGLLCYRNFGKKSLLEIEEFLSKQGLHFEMDVYKFIHTINE